MKKISLLFISFLISSVAQGSSASSSSSASAAQASTQNSASLQKIMDSLYKNVLLVENVFILTQ